MSLNWSCIVTSTYYIVNKAGYSVDGILERTEQSSNSPLNMPSTLTSQMTT